MTFQPTKPASTDYLATSQGDLQGNFATSNTYFGTDHVAFNAGSNQGKHNKSTYRNQGADPATAATELALYAKNLGGASTLYMRKESNGSVIQLSNEDPLAGSPGQSFLPGGIIMKWGNFPLVQPGGVLINFNTPFNVAVFTLVITAARANAVSVSYTGLGLAGFTAYSSVTNTPIYYIAIGN